MILINHYIPYDMSNKIKPTFVIYIYPSWNYIKWEIIRKPDRRYCINICLIKSFVPVFYRVFHINTWHKTFGKRGDPSKFILKRFKNITMINDVKCRCCAVYILSLPTYDFSVFILRGIHDANNISTGARKVWEMLPVQYL